MRVETSHKHDLLWDFYIDLVHKAIRDNDLLIASSLLVNIIQEEEDLGQLDACLVDTMHCVAERLVQDKKFTEAENVYLQVLETREKMRGPGHHEVGDSLKRLTAMRMLKSLDSIEARCLDNAIWTSLVIEGEEVEKVSESAVSDHPEELVEVGPVGINIAFIRPIDIPETVTNLVSS